MTGADIAQVLSAVGGLGALVAAVGSVIIGVRNSRKADAAAVNAAVAAEEAKRAKAEVILTKDGVFEIGRKVDGRITMLLEAKDAATAASIGLARSEGHAAGVADEQARATVEPTAPAAPVDVRVVQDPSEPAVRVKPEKS